MMDKKSIDQEFVSRYKSIELTAQKMIKKSKKAIDYTALISEAYLELIKKKHKIESQEDVVRFVVRFMFCEINWANSQTNKRSLLDVNKTGCSEMKDLPGESLDLMQIDIDRYINEPANMVSGHILKMMISGRDRKRITEDLGVSESTGKRLVRSMTASLGRMVNN